MENMKFYGLVGRTLDGTKSPWIHNEVFKSHGIPAIYLPFELMSEEFDVGIKILKALNVGGLSVTIPYKTAIMPYLDAIDPLAKRLGAVNVVQNHNGKWIGYNTDGTGLLAVLRRHVPNLEQQSVLVLGAGGAARGICGALLESGISGLGVWNRTLSRASELVEDLKCFLSPDQRLCIVDHPDSFKSYSLIINTTSVGMQPDIHETPADIHAFNKDAVICDIVYKPHWTRFLKEAHSNGHDVIFGIEMLIEQAIHAQKIWLDLSDEDLEPIRIKLIEDSEAQQYA